MRYCGHFYAVLWTPCHFHLSFLLLVVTMNMKTEELSAAVDPSMAPATTGRAEMELLTELEHTLATWRDAFAASPRTSTADGASTLPASPDGYRRRLATFASRTYFAKPLALSPLVCAAFG